MLDSGSKISFVVITHLFTITERSFKKTRTYSIINVLGLTLGITCAAIIFLYVFDEITSMLLPAFVALIATAIAFLIIFYKTLSAAMVKTE